jgi:hypothetical protein
LIKEKVGNTERGKILITVTYRYVERQTDRQTDSPFHFPGVEFQIEIVTWNWLLHSIDRRIMGKENRRSNNGSRKEG